MQAVQQLERTVLTLPSKLLLEQEKASKSKKLRVAAYCRVSTDLEEQQNSYQAQVGYYTKKINDTPEWTMVGIFADEGISGTGTKKRTEFLRLMKLCEQGKVDMILAKSISRFARNTVDCLVSIRQLKEQHVAVVFEKEGLNTMLLASELTITFLGGFAQAESESISKNVTWGKRQAFKDGKVTFQYKKILGYEKGEDGKPMIVPEQAALVKRIFFSYLAGYSISKIKKELESEKIPSPTGKALWSTQNIQTILGNEKYIGDALLQKTYVVDFLTKKSKKNNGEIPQYYVENNHEAIIPREIFHKVQEETAQRNNMRKVAQKSTKTGQGKYSSKYMLTGLVHCGDCGTQYRRTTWAKKAKKKIVWRCITRLEYGPKYCNKSPAIEEYRLHDALVCAINNLVKHRDEVIVPLKESIRAVYSPHADGFDSAAKQSRMAEIDSIMMDLVKLNVTSGAGADYFDGKFMELSDEKKALQDELAAHDQQQVLTKSTAAKLDEIFALLDSADISFKEYDDARVKRLVENIKVLSSEKILVVFKGGIEMEQVL